jgi:hypothetical protein
MDGGLMASQTARIEHIVVDEGCGMDHLDDHCKPHGLFGARSEQFGRQESQGRPETFATEPSQWDSRVETVRLEAVGLRDLCVRISTVAERPLFYALLRRLWELREELDLFDRYVTFHRDPANQGRSFRSDYHLPGTYRGGWVPRLQSLLVLDPDGSLHPAARAPR